MAGTTILGLDVGPNSVGWALIGLNEKGEPFQLVDAGVRVFPEGVEAKTNDPKNKKRRLARAARKLHQRRNQRRYDLADILKNAGLLPKDEKEWATLMQANPYQLRAKGLDEKLTPHELGRAIYHMGQRRGFKSNRKTDSGGDATQKKEQGAVKEGITDLERKMEKISARTLGEYLSKLDPHEIRIRGQYTDRSMYEKEFELLWEKGQKPYYPSLLTDELKHRIHDAIFYQRPLRVQKNLVGECEYEKGKKRSPKGTWYAQQFRLLQEVNNLVMTDALTGEIRPLSPEERKSIIKELGKAEKLEFKKIRKILGQPEAAKFNLEEGGRKYLQGNITEARLRKILGKDYDKLTRERRDEIVHDLLFIDSPDTVKRHAQEKWRLSDQQAEALAGCVMPPGYLNVSHKAVLKMLPFLEEGRRYMGDEENPGAVQLASYKRRDERKIVAKDVLYASDVPQIRNPLVTGALHEVRRVTNAVVRKYGKPDKIRVELARDLKVPLSKRREIQKEQDQNRERNEEAREALRKIGVPEPNGTDILKYKLWLECDKQCPYTGKAISQAALFGPSPEFDIEHILPLPRSGDDSFMNKTLCWNEENRTRKGNKTPWEAYQGTDQWGEILKRIERLPYLSYGKRRKFEMKEIPDGFITRQLNDTRYIAREVRTLLASLAGNINDVQVGKGGVTAKLRGLWGLNSILSGGPEKTRADHRHHAVDAVAIALTSPAVLKKMSDLSARNWAARIREFPFPWESFREDVKKRIEGIIVSHRPQRRVRGALHQETNYGVVKTPDGERYAVRKALTALTKSDLNYIADTADKAVILAHLKANGVDPEKDSEKSEAWKKAMTLPPRKPANNGKDGPPIRRVRLHKPSSGMIKLGYRAVEAGSNHHALLYKYVTGKKQGEWSGEVVRLYDAVQRARNGHAPVLRMRGEDQQFIMSLSINDMINIENGEKAGIWRVQKIDGGNGRITFRPHTVATLEDKSTEWTVSFRPLGKYDPHKIILDPLGQLRRAND